MRLYPRIVFFLFVSSFVPLGVLAVASLRATDTWLRRTIVERQVETAQTLALLVSGRLEEAEQLLRLQMGNFQLRQASDDALTAFLYATWRLSPDISVAVLQDAAGRDLVDPVYQAPGAPSLAPDHDEVPAARVEAFRARVPVPAGPGAVARGRPYRPEGGQQAALPLAIASPWGDGLVLGVELRIGAVAGELGSIGGRELVLLGEDGAELSRHGDTRWVEADRLSALLGSPSADARYETASGDEVMAALAAVPGYPLAVVIAEPASVVAASGRDIRARTLYIAGVALVVALVMGTLLTRSITRPVMALHEAALAVGRGELGRRVDVDGRDELAELGRAFSRMTASLEQNAREIAAKNREIQGWNRELQDRVEQRTAQLKEAQARLVLSGQLAAVSELSAGLAHELNNPLAGLLGLLQIAIARAPDAPETALLRSAEKEALRCREIVGHLLRFTETGGGEGLAREPIDLDELLADVLALMAAHLRARGVAARAEGATGLRVVGDPVALGRALGQLLTSIRGVAAPGATLVLAPRAEGAGAALSLRLDRVSDSQDDWKAAALGFWVARQVLEEHRATLDEPTTPTPGASATWTLHLPGAA